MEQRQHPVGMQQPLMMPQPGQMQQPPMMQQPGQMQQPLMMQQPVQMPAPQPSMTILYTSQGAPVQVVNVNPNDGTYKNYKSSLARSLGIAQIILGVLIIICQIVVTALEASAYEGMVGFWASVIFILAGSFGIQSSKSKSSCSIIVTMILSIIGAVFCTGVLSEGAIGASLATDYYNNYECTYQDTPPYDSHCESVLTAENYVAVTFFSIMVVLGIIEGIIAIIAAALCCHGCCDRSKPGVILSPVAVAPVSYQSHPAPYHPVPVTTIDTPAYTGGTTPPPQYQEKA